QKTYYAVVEGRPAPSGTIDTPIGRDLHVKSRMATFTYTDTRHNVRSALTHYKVLSYFSDCALVEVKPVTGRTHQIRVHFASIGHPIVGDGIYGKKSKHIKRQALHAYRLVFEFDGKQFDISKNVPE